MTKHQTKRMGGWVSLPVTEELDMLLNAVKRETGLSRAEITRQSLILFLQDYYRKSVLDGRKSAVDIEITKL